MESLKGVFEVYIPKRNLHPLMAHRQWQGYDPQLLFRGIESKLLDNERGPAYNLRCLLNLMPDLRLVN